MILMPVVAVLIIGVTVFLVAQARSVIIDRAKAELHQESKANANEIAGRILGFKEFYNGICGTLEQVPFQSDEEIVQTFQFTMQRFPEMDQGFYMAVGHGGKPDYVDVSGWKPDADYDPTSRSWYESGLGKSEMTLGLPRMDLNTGGAVVSISR